MKQSMMRSRAVRSALLASAALGVIATAPTAQAQQQTAQLEEIVVTGSRIRAPNLESTSPVTVLGAEDVKVQGTTRVEDLLNTLPQSFAGQGAAVSNGSTGIATVNLRNLGASRTLVLVDGKRLPVGSPNQAAADLNQIPAELVSRVEVLTGGASAVYGSDAIGGVVNFIMDQDFEGVRVETQYSFYQHKNENDTIQGRVAARNFALPDDNVTDGFQRTYSAVLGLNSEDGKGNITVYATYRSIEALLQSERDYSACSLSAPAGATTYNCGGSSTAFPGRFWTDGGFGPGFGGVGPSYTLDPAVPNSAGFRPWVGARDQYNFAPTNYYQRPDRRFTLGAFGRYEFNQHAEVYTQLMFMDDQTVAQIAPSGIFLQEQAISCSNPMLSAQQVQLLCGQFNRGPNDTTYLLIGRRNVEGGGRQDDLQHTSYRMVGGLRGEIVDGWDYDVFGQYSRVLLSRTYLNDFSIARSAQALNVVRDANGNLVCADAAARAAGCVPYNIFRAGGVTPEALAYIQTPGFNRGSTKQEIVSGSVSGDLGQYGIQSPLAGTGVGIALGGEYRREELSSRFDAAFASGDLAGQGGASDDVNGAFDVRELFGELRVPLAEDQPFAKALSLELGYRWSDYSTAGSTDTYKVAGDWAPISDLKFRGSYNRAVRAPNVIELFTPQNITLGLSNDPCAGTTPTATLAQCARTGVTAAQYGNIAESPANQYNDLTGGNPNLAPEKSDTFTVGTVITPSFLSRFSLAVDYFNIEVEGLIGGIGADTILSKCLNEGDPVYCSRVRRAPGTGSLWLTQAAFVENLNTNTGALKTDGIDVEANYQFDLADVVESDLGDLRFNFTGTYLLSQKTQPLTGDPFYDCAGLYGNQCGIPAPEWRHRARITWNTPWDASLSLSWRHFGSVLYERASDDPQLSGGFSPLNRKLRAMDYFDLAGTYSPLEWVTLRAGVNNVFDRDPPIATNDTNSSAFNNGNTFPQVYDALGRYFFFSASAKF